MVQVKSALAIGEYELKFIVMDHCKATGDAYTLTITVTAVVMSINPLIPSGLFHPNILDGSIYHFKGVCFICFYHIL